MKKSMKKFAIITMFFTLVFCQSILAVDNFKDSFNNAGGGDNPFSGIANKITSLASNFSSAALAIILALSVVTIFIACFRIYFSGQRGIEEGKSTLFRIVLVIAIAVLAVDIVFWIAKSLSGFSSDSNKADELIGFIHTYRYF